ncbi:hypothetical protein D7X33_11920 [Butyricicoccus sp. 1XD8-22]|nr:hypothetical protein D7X33_11920 [Butyricicoccus sp. 1XD8-22]
MQKILPFAELRSTILNGTREKWELAEHFDLPEDFISFALTYYLERKGYTIDAPEERFARAGSFISDATEERFALRELSIMIQQNAKENLCTRHLFAARAPEPSAWHLRRKRFCIKSRAPRAVAPVTAPAVRTPRPFVTARADPDRFEQLTEAYSGTLLQEGHGKNRKRPANLHFL